MNDRHKNPTYPIRLPTELRSELKSLATANRRSLASEIVFRLEEAVRSMQQQRATPAALSQPPVG